MRRYFKASCRGADKAAVLLDRAIALDPLNPKTLLLRILALISSRQFAAALAAIASYNSAHPGEEYSPSMHAIALTYGGDPTAAVAVAARGQETFPRA